MSHILNFNYFFENRSTKMKSLIISHKIKTDRLGKSNFNFAINSSRAKHEKKSCLYPLSNKENG